MENNSETTDLAIYGADMRALAADLRYDQDSAEDHILGLIHNAETPSDIDVARKFLEQQKVFLQMEGENNPYHGLNPVILYLIFLCFSIIRKSDRVGRVERAITLNNRRSTLLQIEKVMSGVESQIKLPEILESLARLRPIFDGNNIFSLSEAIDESIRSSFNYNVVSVVFTKFPDFQFYCQLFENVELIKGEKDIRRMANNYISFLSTHLNTLIELSKSKK